MQGNVGIVTGGASGIGEGVVRRLLREGARVYAVDVDADAIGRIRASCATNELIAVLADITNERVASEVVSRCICESGRIDFLVNVAGVMQPPVPLTELAPKDYERVLAVNLTGSFLFYQATVKAMVQAGTGGAIVNVASTGGFRPVINAGAYIASKHGVIGLTTSAALETAALSIRVNAVCPGVTDTPLFRASVAGGPAEALVKQIPMRRIAHVDEIANAVCWLLSEQASYITGAVLVVDGGISLV